MASLHSLPSELLLQILRLLASTSLNSLTALTSASSQCARVYLSHKEVILPLTLYTYLGPFVGPALAISKIDHVNGDCEFTEAEVLATASLPPTTQLSLAELQAAQTTHRMFLETLVLAFYTYQRLPANPYSMPQLSPLVSQLRSRIDDGYTSHSDLGLQDAVEWYIYLLQMGPRRAGCKDSGKASDEFWKEFREKLYLQAKGSFPAQEFSVGYPEWWFEDIWRFYIREQGPLLKDRSAMEVYPEIWSTMISLHERRNFLGKDFEGRKQWVWKELSLGGIVYDVSDQEALLGEVDENPQ